MRGFALLFALGLLPAAATAQIVPLMRVDIRPEAHPHIDDRAQAEAEAQAVPGNTSFIDEKSWSEQRATNIKDITDYVPGIFAQPRNGAESARLSVRGSGLSTAFQGRGLLLLQDHIPITMTDGEFEYTAIDPWLIQHATILPGANALEAGASTFGGAILFSTPNGETEKGLSLRSEIGSFDTLHAQARQGRAWEGGDLFAAVTGFAQEGFREQNAQQTGRFNGNWGWHNPQFANRVTLSHTTSDAQIPGTLTLAEIDADPQAANPLNRKGDYQRNLDITRLGDTLAWQTGDDRAEATLYYVNRHLDNPVTTYEFQQNHDAGLRTQYIHRAGETRWIAGLNTAYGMAEESRFRNLHATTGAPILTRDLQATTHEAYGQVEQPLAGPLTGIASLQASYATRDIHQHMPSEASQNEDYAGLNPRIGLRWDMTAQAQAFANLSRSFEPPTFGELSGGNAPGFKRLRAQTATTAEIGARGEESGMHWQAAYFHGWLRDEFVNYRFADGTTDTVNAPRSTRDGIELGLNGDAAKDLWQADDALNLRAAYTYSRYRLDKDALYGDNALPGVPPHYLRAEAIYRHPSGVSLGPNLEWSPQGYPVDLTNSLNSTGYALLGARAAWQDEGGNLDLYLDAHNLLDTHYAATTNVVPDAAGTDGRYFYPGEGRALYAGLRWKL